MNSRFNMPRNNLITIPQGVAKVLTLAELQNCGAWQRALQNKSKDHRYYEIVDETLECGFEHYYLLIEDEAGNMRAIQPALCVRQSLVGGVPGKIRAVVDLSRPRRPGCLTMRVLMVGCGACVGRLGACEE